MEAFQIKNNSWFIQGSALSKYIDKDKFIYVDIWNNRGFNYVWISGDWKSVPANKIIQFRVMFEKYCLSKNIEYNFGKLTIDITNLEEVKIFVDEAINKINNLTAFF